MKRAKRHPVLCALAFMLLQPENSLARAALNCLKQCTVVHSFFTAGDSQSGISYNNFFGYHPQKYNEYPIQHIPFRQLTAPVEAGLGSLTSKAIVCADAAIRRGLRHLVFSGAP